MSERSFSSRTRKLDGLFRMASRVGGDTQLVVPGFQGFAFASRPICEPHGLQACSGRIHCRGSFHHFVPMDPLSIAVSSASLMTACTKLSGFIYTTITKVQNVDGTLQTLAIEINSLSQVLASLTTSLKDPLLARSVFSSQTKHEIQHWKNVKRCMDDCKDTLSTLEKMVKNCEKSGKTGGLFGSSKKFVSLSLNSEAISRSQVKIKSYTRTLQLSLQLITV